MPPEGLVSREEEANAAIVRTAFVDRILMDAVSRRADTTWAVAVGGWPVGVEQKSMRKAILRPLWDWQGDGCMEGI